MIGDRNTTQPLPRSEFDGTTYQCVGSANLSLTTSLQDITLDPGIGVGAGLWLMTAQIAWEWNGDNEGLFEGAIVAGAQVAYLEQANYALKPGGTPLLEAVWSYGEMLATVESPTDLKLQARCVDGSFGRVLATGTKLTLERVG